MIGGYTTCTWTIRYRYRSTRTPVWCYRCYPPATRIPWRATSQISYRQYSTTSNSSTGFLLFKKKKKNACKLERTLNKKQNTTRKLTVNTCLTCVHNALYRNLVPQDRAASREPGQALCMSQYQRLFTSYRVPGVDRDHLLSMRPEDNEHIIVAHQGQVCVVWWLINFIHSACQAKFKKKNR